MGCPAPPKVRVFAWRVMTNSLATWANKASRRLELTDVCPLCGVEREDGFHALCRCPLARELWRVMALDWNIPKVESIRNTGPEWLFTLLEPLDETARLVVIMIMWRIWHVRNEITHDKPPPPAEASRRFLHGYITSLLCIQQCPGDNLEKGKMVVTSTQPSVRPSPVAKVRPRWTPPSRGWAKLNPDGSFVAPTGAAGGGMVLRDDRGDIIYSACRELRTCDNVLEAELSACREGLDLALHRTTLPIIIEMDSAEAVSMLRAPTTDRSQHRTLVEEINRLVELDAREILFTHCSRWQNIVSHELAAYGRSTPRTAVWFTAGPDFVVNLAMAERPP